MPSTVAIGDGDLVKIQGVLERLLADAGCAAVLLIARGGESIAAVGAAPALDMVAVAGLAAGGFGATAPLAQLLGEREFSAVIHEGARQSLHVSAVDDMTILIAVFDERTTVGMVRVFAREAASRLAALLDHTRTRGRATAAQSAATRRAT
jgi:predicted regulator of Ras-like GTPase activity (Roadblock/LC7/MglB family)